MGKKDIATTSFLSLLPFSSSFAESSNECKGHWVQEVYSIDVRLGKLIIIISAIRLLYGFSTIRVSPYRVAINFALSPCSNLLQKSQTQNRLSGGSVALGLSEISRLIAFFLRLKWSEHNGPCFNGNIASGPFNKYVIAWRELETGQITLQCVMMLKMGIRSVEI